MLIKIMVKSDWINQGCPPTRTTPWRRLSQDDQITDDQFIDNQTVCIMKIISFKNP